MNSVERDALADDAGSRWGPRGTAAATFAARLSFEHVSHGYADIEAVRDVSLVLAPGQITCLLGPSGCGKTTLLRLAAGVERPQHGRILLDGREIAGPGVFVPPEKRNVGLMFQDFALFPHLSILENVLFGLRHLDRATAQSEARAALSRVGMSRYESSYPHVLSGGEQQRVALARAIVPRPSVMLMDEPFSGLDQRLRDTVREETLAVLHETRASCLLVTHDPAEAMLMADQIAVMRGGRLVQTDTPANVYRSPQDRETAKFFCDYNEFELEAANGKVETPLGTLKTESRDLDGRIFVLIRPVGVKLARKGTGRQATVIASRYIGDATLLTLGVSGWDEPIKVQLDGNNVHQKGEELWLKLDPQHVHMYPS